MDLHTRKELSLGIQLCVDLDAHSQLPFLQPRILVPFLFSPRANLSSASLSLCFILQLLPQWYDLGGRGFGAWPALTV